jgi:hypothetical protein
LDGNKLHVFQVPLLYLATGDSQLHTAQKTFYDAHSEIETIHMDLVKEWCEKDAISKPLLAKDEESLAQYFTQYEQIETLQVEKKQLEQEAKKYSLLKGLSPNNQPLVLTLIKEKESKAVYFVERLLSEHTDLDLSIFDTEK